MDAGMAILGWSLAIGFALLSAWLSFRLARMSDAVLVETTKLKALLSSMRTTRAAMGDFADELWDELVRKAPGSAKGTAIIREGYIPRERVEAKIRELTALLAEHDALTPEAAAAARVSLCDLNEMLLDESRANAAPAAPRSHQQDE